MDSNILLQNQLDRNLDLLTQEMNKVIEGKEEEVLTQARVKLTDSIQTTLTQLRDQEWHEYRTDSIHFFVHPDVFTYEEFVSLLGGNTAVPNYLAVDIYRNYLENNWPSKVISI